MTEAKQQIPEPTPAEARQAKVEQDAQQRYYEKMTTAGGSGNSSIPPLPSGPAIFSLSASQRAHYSSQQFCEERAAKAASLPEVRKRAEKAQKQVAAVGAELEKATAKLAKLDADTDHLAENADARVATRMKVDMLSQDFNRLGMTAGLAGGQVRELERDLNDPLTEWATARRDWCREALPLIEAALAEAEKVCEWKQAEADTGKPYKGGMPKKGLEKKYGPVSMGPMHKMS